MRAAILIFALALASCAGPSGTTTRSVLAAADASTSLIAGARLTADFTTYAAHAGMDPAIIPG
jgi:hypothetical protein